MPSTRAISLDGGERVGDPVGRFGEVVAAHRRGQGAERGGEVGSVQAGQRRRDAGSPRRGSTSSPQLTRSRRASAVRDCTPHRAEEGIGARLAGVGERDGHPGGAHGASPASGRRRSAGALAGLVRGVQHAVLVQQAGGVGGMPSGRASGAGRRGSPAAATRRGTGRPSPYWWPAHSSRRRQCVGLGFGRHAERPVQLPWCPGRTVTASRNRPALSAPVRQSTGASHAAPVHRIGSRGGLSGRRRSARLASMSTR